MEKKRHLQFIHEDSSVHHYLWEMKDLFFFQYPLCHRQNWSNFLACSRVLWHLLGVRSQGASWWVQQPCEGLNSSAGVVPLMPQVIASTVSWDAASPKKRKEKLPSKNCGLKTHAGSYFFGISGSFVQARSRFCRTWLRADCFHTVGVFSLRNNPDDVKQMRRSATRRKNRRLNLDFGVKNGWTSWVVINHLLMNIQFKLLQLKQFALEDREPFCSFLSTVCLRSEAAPSASTLALNILSALFKILEEKRRGFESLAGN